MLSEPGLSDEEVRGPDEKYVCYPSRGKPSFHRALGEAKKRAEAELNAGSASAVVYELKRVCAVRAIRVEWLDE